MSEGSEYLSATERVRQSCASFSSNCVRIDPVRLKQFAESIALSDIDTFVYSSDGLATNRFEKDIDFPSAVDEAGFLVIAHGLDFGSGYRNMLHSHRNGAGAWITIRSGLISLGQVNPQFESKWLLSLSVGDVQHHFDLAATELAASELLPLAIQLHSSIQEFGSVLKRLGFANPGEYLTDRLEAGNYSAVKLVAHLVQEFPLTFNDCYVVNDQEVFLYKKAQLVVSEIFMRFGYPSSSLDSPDEYLQLHNKIQLLSRDIDDLTAFVDNVVVAVLRLSGILLANEELSAKIEQGQYIEKGSVEEIGLRSKALEATELIVDCVNRSHGTKVLNAQRLCNWMWGCVGKYPENRTYRRHLAPSTSFY